MNNQRTSDAGLAHIMKWEGFVDHIYLCPAGYETVGYGHRLTDADTMFWHQRESAGTRLSRSEGEELLRADVGRAEAAVRKLVKVPLRQGQFDALVDFVFNLGPVKLGGSTLLRKLNAGDYDAVPGELVRWTKVWDPTLKAYRHSEGLGRRRTAAADMWRLP